MTTDRKTSALLHRPGMLLLPLLLAACGGGGGGSGSGGSTAQPLSLTTTNAKPAAADALDNALTGVSSANASLIDALKSQSVAGSAGIPGLMQSATALARLVPATGGTKAAINETANCPLGGSVVAVGNIASDSGFVAGDALSLSAFNCMLTVDGSTATLNGALSFAVNSGSVTTFYPFTAGISFTAINFRTQVGTDSVTVTGDQQLAWNATNATNQTLQSSGTSYNLSATVGGKTRSSIWRNYQQTVTLAGTQVTSSLSTQVESVNSRLGSTPVTYQVTTPAALVGSTTNDDVSSGSLLVTGDRSALLITFTGTNTVDLLVDANGDNTYEQTLPSTMDELATLL